MTAVGFIGLGTMGAPMARNVMKGGHSLTVFDVNRAACDALAAAGAKVAATPKEVAAASDVVITMVPDAPDVEKVALGPDGILAGHAPRLRLHRHEHHRSRDHATRRQGFADAGVEMIDSPVGKTVEHAIAGTSTLMIGGDAAVIDRVRPVLDAWAPTSSIAASSAWGRR